MADRERKPSRIYATERLRNVFIIERANASQHRIHNSANTLDEHFMRVFHVLDDIGKSFSASNFEVPHNADQNKLYKSSTTS